MKCTSMILSSRSIGCYYIGERRVVALYNNRKAVPSTMTSLIWELFYTEASRKEMKLSKEKHK